jgi:hypothetical protein
MKINLLAKLKVEHNIQMRELQTEIQRLRTEKINLEIDNDYMFLNDHQVFCP